LVPGVTGDSGNRIASKTFAATQVQKLVKDALVWGW
jgi:hypothetical protein